MLSRICHKTKVLTYTIAYILILKSEDVFAQTSDEVFLTNRINTLIFVTVFSVAILLYTRWAKQGKPLFLRKIAGLQAVEEAVGRATEMGRPVLYVPGIDELDQIETIAGVSILGRVAKITAQYDTPLMVPVRYPLVYAAA